MRTTAPFGSWPSIVDPAMVAGHSVRVSACQLSDGKIYWLEGRPQEKGRQVVVEQNAAGQRRDLIAAPWNARSQVHEYGGGSYLVANGHLFFVNAADQQIYRLKIDEGQEPQALTFTPQCRYADFCFDQTREQLYCVCEDHSTGAKEPNNYLVVIDLRSEPAGRPGPPVVVARGDDFYSTPRLSPCGKWMSWLSWNHPALPWDATQCWIAARCTDGTVEEPVCIAGRDNDESVFQPQWSPAGDLYWVSDQNNWWNIYRLPRSALTHLATQPAGVPSLQSVIEPLTGLTAEFAAPQWAFAMSTFGFLDARTILATFNDQGLWALASIETSNGMLTPIPTPLSSISDVQCQAGAAVLIGASPTSTAAVYQWREDELSLVAQPASETPLDDRWISIAQRIAFPTTHGEEGYGFFYPPRNPDYYAPQNTAPPVIVLCHGGPTGAADSSLSLKIQFWTSRGFAVLDVNYRGSTGFGRRYRHSLYGHWGVKDVEDLCAAATYVTERGWAAQGQRIIKGSSAGGYSVLAALVATETFNAGVSLYGVGDLETLAKDTHKFEARYLDSLIGPYPEQQALYKERSPIHRAHQIRCPLLVFQGLKDKVVPPDQARLMVEAVKSRGLPVAYLTFAEEAHGFRQATTIERVLEAELSFYQRVFHLATDASTLPPLHIENFD